MIWYHHHQFCCTVPRTLAIQHAVFTLHNPCILHTLQSLHFSVVFSDLRLTLSKYFSLSCTVFYFSTLLFYYFSPLSALCTVHIHSVLQLLVSGQLKNKDSLTAQHGQLFELSVCHLLFISSLLLAPDLYNFFMSSTTFGTIYWHAAYFVTKRVKYFAHNFETSYCLCMPVLLA